MSRRNTLRFGDFIQAMSVDSQRVPLAELMPEPLFDRHGNEFPQPVPKMKLGGGDIKGVPGNNAANSYVACFTLE